MRYLSLSVFTITLALIFSQGAAAHTDEYLDTVAAPHGGQLRMAGIYHYELVVQPREITVYVTDHAGTKFDTRGAIGTATVLSGGTESTVTLEPAGENAMKSAGKFVLHPDMEIVVSIALPGQAAQQARFKPLQKSKKGGAEK